MNIYADRGNVVFLQRRCEWRGIGFTYAAAGTGERSIPRRTTSSTSAAARIATSGWSRPICSRPNGTRSRRRSRRRCRARGLRRLPAPRVVIPARRGAHRGPRVAPLHTVREPGPRLIGNVSIEVDLGSGPRLLAGFENHGGRTYIGPGGAPLGRVLHGHGNNGRDGLEGIVRGNLIGTYLHGPLLPKNAWLADELIARAIERREGTRPELEPLDDRFEDAAHADAERAAARWT